MALFTTENLALLVLAACLNLSAGRVFRRQMSNDLLTTRNGQVRGVLVQFPTAHLRSVVGYFGMGYASLLGGSMRFMPPTTSQERWNGVRSLIEERPACPQRRLDQTTLDRIQPKLWRNHLKRISHFVEKQTEDCLSLNLYVPTEEGNETESMAVMVFIHGESFETGTGNAYDGSVLASYGHVIVITVNYRLGVLGFLSTGESGTTGNYAVLDLLAALHWIRENIHSFNGDPNRITLFGHGHGAALVNILLVTPVTKEGMLFRRAILQSGSALSTWSMSVTPIDCTKRLATRVNCSKSIDDPPKLRDCLRNKTFVSLVDSAPLPPKYYACFGPSINQKDSVLKRSVQDLIANPVSFYEKVDVLMGVTKQEAYNMLTDKDLEDGMTKTRHDQIIRTYVHNVFRYYRKRVLEVLDHYYTDWDQPMGEGSYRNSIMELLSDGQYVAPLINLINAHSGKGHTYLYNFDYTSDEKRSSLPKWSGAVHGDELPYVFGAPLVDGVSPFRSRYSKTDRMISEAMMRYWTNFAKTGDPNKPLRQQSVYGGRVKNRFINLKWPQYDVVNQNYLYIGKRPHVDHHYRGKKVALWLDLIAKKTHVNSPNPEDHILPNSDNQSSFDSPERLLIGSVTLFPPPPPSPPTPPPKHKQNKTWPFHHLNYNRTHNVTGYYPVYKNGADRPHHEVAKPTPKTSIGADVSDGHHFIPMSITISVGVALLFLNILIFAGIYYQRDRIRKIKIAAEMEGNEEVRIKRKLDKDSGSVGPESVGLLSQHPATFSQQNSYEDNIKHKTINSDKYAVPVKSSHVPPGQYKYSSPSGNGTHSMQRHAGTLPRGDPAYASPGEGDRSRTLDTRITHRPGASLQNSTTAV